MPWNFPFWKVFRFVVPTLMSGNLGILKHASNLPQCSLAISQVFEDAGFPKGIFKRLLKDACSTLGLVEDSRIKAKPLTGCEKAVVAVAAATSSQIKKLLLELRGSYPYIILKNANVPFRRKGLERRG